MKTKKPNIIFFFADQQRWDTCGCYGQQLNTTPNLDQMAKEGTLFENTFSCQPVCGPARAALMTGKYPTRTMCHVNGRCLPTNEKTIANYFTEAGYETGYIGKWHLASHRGIETEFQKTLNCETSPIPKERRGGFNDFWLASDILEFTSHGYGGHMFDGDGNMREFPEGRFRADAQTDWALEYLQTRNQEKPFFLFLSYIEPHHQNDRNCYEGPNGSKEKYKNFIAPKDLEKAKEKGDWEKEYPDYLGCINSLDENLGRIRAELKRLEMDEDTIVIYTSDHGSHFCTRNHEYKRSCHESSIHIPLIISGPGFENGGRIDELTSLIDLPPTLMQMANIDVPKEMDGYSLNNLPKGIIENWQDNVFIQISESQNGRCIRTKKWMYSVKTPGSKSSSYMESHIYCEEFLYDLENDPHEMKNLVLDDKFKEIRENLAGKLLKKMKQIGEPNAKIIPYTEEEYSEESEFKEECLDSGTIKSKNNKIKGEK